MKLNWEIPRLAISQIGNQRIEFHSDIFHIFEYGCRIVFKFLLNPQMLFLVEYLDQQLNRSFPLNGQCKYTFIIRDQSINETKYDFIRIFEPGFNDWLKESMYAVCLTKKRLTELFQTWLKDGKVRIEVIVEPLAQVLASEPLHHGSIIWKIDSYKTVRESYQYGRQYSLSESFYSSEKGYRMRALMWIGEQVEIVVFFLKGPWDNDLPKKFNHKITITFLNQTDSNDIRDSTITMESSSLTFDSFFAIISQDDLDRYVKNDTLSMCIKVQPL